MSACGASPRPQHVGILAMDVYFPSRFVNQTDLEVFDGVGAGKYTIGLGQTNMAFCGDREDIVSICMTAMSNLFEKYKISPRDIGRFDVGTESLIDKSKSVKTDLMRLFEEAGNFDVEGADNINACYGGTAALLNAVSWVESSSWDGRFALVVCGDIAVYEEGPARPTGGCCASAMLIGPDAPLALIPGLRCSYMQHAYDFYKPDLSSEFPVVDGPLSIVCYYKAIDSCYQGFLKKWENQNPGSKADLASLDYLLFHSPFNKLVQKSFARMVYNDCKRDSAAAAAAPAALQGFLDTPYEQTLGNRDFEAALAEASKDLYAEKVAPGTLLSKELGNSYTCSLYAGLAGLIGNLGTQLLGKRISLFSYGSGLCSTLFAVEFRDTSSPVFSLKNIFEQMNILARLDSRTKVTPEEFSQGMRLREESYGRVGYVPTEGIDHLFPGTYFVEEVDSKYRRKYSRT